MPPEPQPVRTPIVFLHAYPLDSSMWEPQVDAFEGRQVLRPDLPGFGGRGPTARTLTDFAAAVLDAMNDAGIDRAVIVGLSMGGYTAFRLYDGWPDRVAALVLADTRAEADDDQGRARRKEQAERARGEGIGWLADAMLPNLLGETTRSSREEVVRRVRAIIDRAIPEGVTAALDAMREREDSTPLLSRIAVPVLAVVGSEGTVTPEPLSRAIAERVPNGRLVVIPSAGHLSNLENPSAFNAALRSFLDEVDGSRARR